MNLRGLGSNRNLVLLDGRRLPLADISGNVDINLIPDAILASVQTITGGASAVYGSDAMSGVVNFITLGHFEGIRTDLQYGNSERGDYEQITSSAAFGTSFADNRGQALLSVGYSTREGLSGEQARLLRSGHAFLVHRTRNVRALRHQLAESGRGQQFVCRLMGWPGR